MYIESDMKDQKAAEENHYKSTELLHKVRQDNINIKDGEKYNISDDDLVELTRLEVDYRKIPKEADADEFAKKMMEQMDIGEFIKKLG